MKCPNCSFENDAKATNCAICGSELEQQAQGASRDTLVLDEALKAIFEDKIKMLDNELPDEELLALKKLMTNASKKNHESPQHELPQTEKKASPVWEPLEESPKAGSSTRQEEMPASSPSPSSNRLLSEMKTPFDASPASRAEQSLNPSNDSTKVLGSEELDEIVQRFQSETAHTVEFKRKKPGDDSQPVFDFNTNEIPEFKNEKAAKQTNSSFENRALEETSSHQMKSAVESVPESSNKKDSFSVSKESPSMPKDKVRSAILKQEDGVERSSTDVLNRFLNDDEKSDEVSGNSFHKQSGRVEPKTIKIDSENPLLAFVSVPEETINLRDLTRKMDAPPHEKGGSSRSIEREAENFAPVGAKKSARARGKRKQKQRKKFDEMLSIVIILLLIVAAVLVYIAVRATRKGNDEPTTTVVPVATTAVKSSEWSQSPNVTEPSSEPSLALSNEQLIGDFFHRLKQYLIYDDAGVSVYFLNPPVALKALDDLKALGATKVDVYEFSMDDFNRELSGKMLVYNEVEDKTYVRSVAFTVKILEESFEIVEMSCDFDLLTDQEKREEATPRDDKETTSSSASDEEFFTNS